MICPSCNVTDNALDAVFCHNCGVKLPTTVIKDSFWNRKKKTIYVLLGIIVIIVFSCFAYFPVKKNDNDLKKSVMEVLYQKNISISGVYKVNIEIQNSNKIFMHAELISIGEHDYIINLYEDTGQYANNTLSVSVVDDEGNVFSDFFGKGKIAFNKKHNELELKFTDKNDIVWIFLK